jgi:hypothetical protein
MEETELEDLYKIDRDRLIDYYQRIEKRAKDKNKIHTIANFLEYESIGSSQKVVKDVLTYYQEKIVNRKEVLDFAFEWIRAHKIRLKYKEYLVRSQFDNYELALDDCIFLFFLPYDDYIRSLLKDEVKEFEISTLYEVFFNSYSDQNLDFNKILEKHRKRVPTVYCENKKVNINIITLRSGLSEVILDDYNATVNKSNKIEKAKKESSQSSFQYHNFSLTRNKINSKGGKVQEKKDGQFSGALLERLLKSCCISKNEIPKNEIENAISQFLSSYFKFDNTYKLMDFKDQLIESLASDIIDGLTTTEKESFTFSNVKNQIKDVLFDFVEKNEVKNLGGIAWKNDLTPLLTNFLMDFMNQILNK